MRPRSRRLLTIPGYALACLFALASAPLWIPAAAILGRLRGDGGVALRCGLMLTVYLLCETAGLLIAGTLWLLRPLAGWDAARWRALHFRLQDAWGDALLRSLNERSKTTLIVVTHNIPSARMLGDELVFLHEGRIIERGDAAALERSESPLVREFMRSEGSG